VLIKSDKMVGNLGKSKPLTLIS